MPENQSYPITIEDAKLILKNSKAAQRSTTRRATVTSVLS